VHDRYHGGEQVHAANGTGMDIVHVGHSIVSTPDKLFHLNNVLHVSKASKNLCSVNRFVRDNDVFIEFHPRHFLIKDQVTKTTLHSGRCEGGLYPLRSTTNKQALGVVKPSASLWHQRLGHPSTRVVQDVISRHKLPFFKIRIKIGCVMHVSKARAINCLTLSLAVCHPVLWTLFSLMYGGLPQLLLVAKTIMSASLMIIRNSFGFIFCSINQKFFNAFVISKI
jgi:hypothetical protein